MRLLIFTTGDVNREFGGGEVYIRSLIKALTEAGHEVKTSGDAAVIGREKPEIVHAHSGEAEAALAARESGAPCVVTVHHGGLVCPQGALLDREDRVCRRPIDQRVCTRCCLRGRWWGNVPISVGRFFGRLPNIPFITPALTRSSSVADRKKQVVALARDVSMFVAPSAAARDALLRNGVPRERMTLVRHGVRPLAPRPLPGGLPLRFAYVGRIGYEKGVHVLVEAFRSVVGDCELHLLGRAHSKWDKRYLRSIATPPRVIFHGHITDDALADAWTQCHVTVLPSICMEVFGLVVQESFSLGRPVIVTDCGGPAEQVRDGTDGFIAPTNDPVALAATMQRFVDDPALAATMARRLPPVHTMAQHVADLEQVYVRCVGQRRAQ